jgi:hypothetical protein
LAGEAAVVVTDDYPCFFLPRMVAAAGSRLTVLLEAADSNGVMPLTGTDHSYTAAVHFRRYLQKHLRQALLDFPSARPFFRTRLPALDALPAAVTKRWPPASCCAGSSRTGCMTITWPTITRTDVAPAGSHPICTSGTCQLTRSSMR